MVEKAIGIDFGSAGIKLAEVKTHKGVTTVTAQAFIPLDEGIISSGVPDKERVDYIAAELRAALKENRITTRRAVMGLNSPDHVFVSRSTTRWHHPKEFRQAIVVDHAAKPSLILGAPEGCLIEPVVYRDFIDPEDGERKVDALLSAVSPDLVDLQASILKKAGLTVVGSDCAAYAALRAVKAVPREAGNLDIIADVGDDVLTITIHENGVPYAVSLLKDSGGRAASHTISSYLNDDNMVKINREKIRGDNPELDAPLSEYATRVAVAIQSTLDEYVYEHPGGRPIGVTVIGGGASVPFLADAIQETLGVPCQTGVLTEDLAGDPAPRTEVDDINYDNFVALGLAMGATV